MTHAGRIQLAAAALGLALLVAGPGRAAAQGVPDSLAGRGANGTLFDPQAAGRPRAPATAEDNREDIKLLEHKLKCQCGCNLDIFTCRTTDFSCTTSPRLHQEILALSNSGMNEAQIVQEFVKQYGEQALMAPPAEGFNLAGYLVPGAVILAFGVFLTVWLNRRRLRTAEAAGGSGWAVSPDVPESPAPAQPTDDEMRRLKEALRELDD